MKSFSLFLGYWSFRRRSKNTVTNGVGCWMKMPITTRGYSLSWWETTSIMGEVMTEQLI